MRATLLLQQLDSFSEANYFHTFCDICSTRDQCLLFATVVDPNLAIEALAVPAKVAVRDTFQREKLKASEQRVVFRDHVFFADDFDLDELTVRLKNVGQRHIYNYGRNRCLTVIRRQAGQTVRLDLG